mgnify:FL=1
MSQHKRGFLVAQSVEGRWQHVSHSGYLLAGVGACHPLVGSMTETAHDQICQAVVWMADERGVVSVDLTPDATYRVSWL